MEPYVALIKAIIISGIYVNGVSTVTITDQYIVSVVKSENPISEKEDIQYRIYDLNKQMIFQMNTLYPQWDSFTVAESDPIDINGINRNVKLLSTNTHNESFQGYKCKVVEEEFERYSATEGSIKYKEVSYYAKIPLLDSALNTPVKKNFAGFLKSPDDRFPYLISQYKQYKSGMTKNDILIIVEESGIDPALLEDLINGKIEQ